MSVLEYKTMNMNAFINMYPWLKIYINNITYWKKGINGYILTTFPKDIISDKDTLIRFHGILYFYVENNKVYTITIGEGIDYQPLEDKLYHLIHGPKALSIPDAFRILEFCII